RGTLIRIFSPEGTLVIEVDDPAISVSVDGSEIAIKGAGVNEIRVKPGRYMVEASKAGRIVHQELVTVVNNGRPIVRVLRGGPKTKELDAETKAAARRADAAGWERSVAALPALERAKAVARRLQELNPGFDGTLTPTIELGEVTGLAMNVNRVTDITPI